MNYKISKFALAGVLLACMSGAFAGQQNVTGKILTTWADTAYYGRCIIEIADHVPTIDCPANWVSLDCAGSYYSKEDTRRMWDSAQLAYALDLDVSVTIMDTQKHSGYCVASHLTVNK